MNNDNKNRKSKFMQKEFYLTVAIGLIVLALSLAVSYGLTRRLPGNSGSTTLSQGYSNVKQPAGVDKTDVEDTRTTLGQMNESNLTLESREEQDGTEPATESNPTKESEVTSNTEYSNITEVPDNTGGTSAEAQPTTQSAKKQSFVYPANGKILKGFSDSKLLYSKTMNDWRTHSGTDFETNEGDKVYSIGEGKVKKVTSEIKWGYCIEVDYGEYVARYCGIDQEGAVSVGQQVYKNSTIGTVKTAPCESLDGTHLHFEMLKGGKPVDPIAVIDGSGTQN